MNLMPLAEEGAECGIRSLILIVVRHGEVHPQASGGGAGDRALEVEWDDGEELA